MSTVWPSKVIKQAFYVMEATYMYVYIKMSRGVRHMSSMDSFILAFGSSYKTSPCLRRKRARKRRKMTLSCSWRRSTRKLWMKLKPSRIIWQNGKFWYSLRWSNNDENWDSVINRNLTHQGVILLLLDLIKELEFWLLDLIEQADSY